MTAKLQKASKTLNPTFSSTPIANQHETQPDPSPRPLPTIPIPDSIPEGFWWESWNQDNEIKHLKAQLKKLKRKPNLFITTSQAWIAECIHEAKIGRKEIIKEKVDAKGVCIQTGEEPAKSEPTVHKDPAFDDLDDVDVNDAMDYMETDAYMQKGVSTEDQVSTVKPDEGTDKPEVSTAKPKEVEVSTDKLDEGTAELKDGTSDESTAPTTVFRDDETIAEFLIRPRATSTRSVLTLKPLPKIDPKDKGKKVLEEEAESEGVYEAERSIDLLLKDEEITRKVQEDWEAEEEMKKLSEEERGSLLNKATAIRSRPPTRTQLRNQMITYLKHVGGKKHTDLKNKNFEEIQVLYKKVKRSDKDFIAIGSAEDERQIKEKNEESKDPKKKRVVNETPREEDIAKVHAEQEVTKQGTKKRKSGHVKMIARKRPRPQPDDDMHNGFLITRWDYLVFVYRVNGHFRAFNNLMEGDLKIMMESSTKENDQGDFWNNQQEWEIFRWRLMLDFGLEVKEESTAALHLISDGGFVALEEVLKRLNYRKKVKYNKEIRTLKIWVFFLATKDETPKILKNFITGIENQSDHKVKTIRSDNRTEFKNRIMNEFCKMKGIRREFSIARTPQQNSVAERKNRTLIEAARTMLADSKLPTTFWAEAVNTACYVQNILVLGVVIKPHNKTPYKFFLGRKHALSFIRPFGCLVTILNTLDHLVQRTQKMRLLMMLERRMELRIQQKKNDIIWFRGGIRLNSTNRLNTVSSPVNVVSSSFTTVDPGRARDQRNEFESVFGQDKDANSTYMMLTPDTADLQDTGIFDNTYDDDEDVGAEADLNNLETTMNVEAMQKELLQFRLQKVWRLVDLPKGKHAIGTKWVYRNKMDDRGIVVRNKARLVAQGYTQEEGIIYDESAFFILHNREEVYACQHPGFEDPQFPNNVYMVDKALYGLHQDPRAWYETLSTYLLENGFRRRIIDKTLFIKKENSDNPGIRNLTSEAFSDSDYVELALTKRILDRKSTTGGCQFLGKRLISWQCKKQTVVANSTTEAE
ncbi:retrovirus-related pol polyprotein from transposon TNT 1-94 [Tanacetum coccineum]